MIAFVIKQRVEGVKAYNGNVVRLDSLAVLPAYQRRDVGGALLAWGLNEADGLGSSIFLESSIAGRGLNEKNGFVFQKAVEIPDPERLDDREKGRCALLV